MTEPSILTFGEFRLDPVSGHLYERAVPVPLTPKAFSLLEYLASRSGRLVGKQELLDAIWPQVFVGDAVLKGTIREVRKALGDDPQAPQFIETAHRRGYRFIAPVTIVASPEAQASGPSSSAADTRELTPAAVPRVRYARSGHVNIAYQVVGSGPIDLVFVMGWVSHLEYFWNEPSFARFLTRLSGMGRLILFDKRGTGLSDAVPVSELPSLEQRLDDVRAVMEASGSERAVLVGVSEGGPLCSVFAATYPERTEALIVIGSYARRLWDVDYPWGPTREQRDAFCDAIVAEWGGPVGIEERGPSKASDPVFRDWWASYLRMGASPGAAVALTRMNADIDIRHVLPTIRVPTLVLHRRGDRLLRIEEGRYLASRIPGAKLVELDGDDHLPFLGDQDAILREVERFVTHAHVRTTAAHALASVATISCGAPGDDLQLLRQVFDREVAWHRGRVLADDGARLVAAFDGPARAVQCASATVTIAARLRIVASAGVHIGELAPATPEGEIIDLSAELAHAAAGGEVVVSRPVVDLLSGSGLEFIERGRQRVGHHSTELMTLALKQ